MISRLLAPLTRNRHITPSLPHSLSPLLNPRPDPRINKQPDRRRNKHKHHDFILRAIPLKASRQDIFFLCTLTDGQVVVEAEFAVAVGTSGLFGVGRGGGGESDDGAVGEAGAFAEGC